MPIPASIVHRIDRSSLAEILSNLLGFTCSDGSETFEVQYYISSRLTVDWDPLTCTLSA